MRATQADLPHNALFTRRNNFFGTRPSVGIQELIAEGVTLDQVQVRFDDFAATRIDGIPLPRANSALAVSHGFAEIPAHLRRHRDATHYLEIALRSAPSSAPIGQPRVPSPQVS